jgi:pimeloyl-ACP methyl ester carboxylesterase
VTRGCGNRSSPSSASAFGRSAPTSASSAARPGRRAGHSGRTSSASSTSGVEQAALVSLPGGRIALDVALAHPDRLWAVVGVAPGLGGHDGAPYTEEQGARYDAAEAEGDLEAAMAVDFEVWAPLGADERIRQLWRATPDANPLPDGVEPLAPVGAPAKERLGELAIPVLVVTAKHDPPGFREIGPLVARAAPDARHVELDSDHYLTLREPELVARTLLDFLSETAQTR